MVPWRLQVETALDNSKRWCIGPIRLLEEADQTLIILIYNSAGHGPDDGHVTCAPSKRGVQRLEDVARLRLETIELDNDSTQFHRLAQEGVTCAPQCELAFFVPLGHSISLMAVRRASAAMTGSDTSSALSRELLGKQAQALLRFCSNF